MLESSLTPYVVQVTDIRVTQLVLHAKDSGEAVRLASSQGRQIFESTDVRARALVITERDYDRAVEHKIRFAVPAEEACVP